MVQNLLKKHKKKLKKVRIETGYRYGMLEKGTLHFHDFDHISKTYPLQSLIIKKCFKDGSGYKKRGIPTERNFRILKVCKITK
jgi:hypothetical protein